MIFDKNPNGGPHAKKIGVLFPFSYFAEFYQFDIDSETNSMVNLSSSVVFIVVKAENDFDFRSLTFAPALYLIQQTPPRLPVHQSQPKFRSKCFGNQQQNIF